MVPNRAMHNIYPILKLTHELSRKKITFFEVSARVSQGEFITDLHCKPADAHQNLHSKSCHHRLTSSSFVFSLAQWMRETWPKKTDLVANVKQLKEWFRERGHAKDMVNKETKVLLETPSSGCAKISERKGPESGATCVLLLVTLLCVIVEGSNNMHQRENYQDFLKCGELFLGHSLIIIQWTWGFFFPKSAIWPMQCNGQTNHDFRYSWNIYKNNN